MHNPEPNDLVKADEIQRCVQAARDQPEAVMTLFLDEFTFYRWAGTAPVYSAAGRVQPKVVFPCQFNNAGRMVAVINAVSGQVLDRVRFHISVAVLAELLGTSPGLPKARTIYLIQDNWHHVHFPPRQLAAAQQANLTLVALPTNSPRLNPIEKRWRKLKQEVLLMHSDGRDWDRIKARGNFFLDQFASGSLDPVRLVGLLPC
ncbi:MAG TPA: transposase [Anaerolineaceae bacterium]|nr:transposase [Anaerolineaceae bacterium]